MFLENYLRFCCCGDYLCLRKMTNIKENNKRRRKTNRKQFEDLIDLIEIILSGKTKPSEVKNICGRSLQKGKIPVEMEHQKLLSNGEMYDY